MKIIDGLALSGGGVRAALFHIGVLARLAELDLLRQVEVLSTVSGGSLVGVRYYLHVKNLLEKSAAIEKQDYIDIVLSMSREFLKDVQKDLRARAYASVWRANSEAFGMLCEKHLYKGLVTTDGKRNKKRPCMTDLKIEPKNGSQATVPDLWINATSLSSGQQWVFTPTKMGTITVSNRPSRWRKPNEDAGGTRSDLQTLLMCLEEPVEYSEFPPDLKEFPVGRAVAASACVPGIFPPIRLSFWENFGIHLVDGGVIDNLGLRPLALKKCRSTLVSDASAPGSVDIGALKTPLQGFWGSYRALLSFSQAASLHLWEEYSARMEGDADSNHVLVSLPGVSGTNDGLNGSVLEAIKSIRTDLDLFTDLEGYALMYAGYQIASSKLPTPDKTERWPFLLATEKFNKNSDKLRAAHSRLKLMRIVYSNRPRWILAILLCVGLHLVAVPLFPRFAQLTGWFIVPAMLVSTGFSLIILLVVIWFLWTSAMVATSWTTFLLGRILTWRDGLDERGVD
jgi:predicted acylesterase/phospholipase RssA